MHSQDPAFQCLWHALVTGAPCQTLLGCSLTHDFDKHNYDSVCSGAEFLMIGLSQQNTTFRNPSRRLTSCICSCRLFATFFGELPAETLCEKKSVSSF